MGLLIKGLLGALVVVLIGVLAKTKNYAIAGLIPLFPTFALIAHYIVASERGIEALRATIVFGMWSIVPYFIYLLSLWYFTGIMRLPLALAGAVGCWGLCAWLLILAGAASTNAEGGRRRRRMTGRSRSGW
jgi:uncharacterized membrane protein (GlpM family)